VGDHAVPGACGGEAPFDKLKDWGVARELDADIMRFAVK
jgi:hypothetical protein